MTADALALEGVRAAVGGRQLLDGVDLAIPARGLVGIVGPNGSGKTSLLRAALGLLRCDEGAVRIDGRLLVNWPPHTLARNVGYMAQHAASHWDLRVDEMLRLQVAAPSAELLRRCDLVPLLGRRFATLSGGEKARVGVARALVHEPRLLLADEPAAHLDIPHHHRLMALLQETARERAVVVVLHDLHVASMYCERLALMAGGRVLVHGAPDDVLAPGPLAAAYGEQIGAHAVGRLRFFTSDLPVEARR